MKAIRAKILISAMLVSVNVIPFFANDVKPMVRLTGQWKFSIGDNMEWANPEYDDSDWDNIFVPSDWERSGYRDYNGFAWYRKSFEISNFPKESPVYLDLGRIDDVDEVYLNGKLIGSSGSFYPNYKSANDAQRRYIIPDGILKNNQTNVISIRVFDGWGIGGIKSGMIGVFYDADYSLIDIPLYGDWKFKLGNRREWRDPDYNTSGWDKIQVPSAWESQGYPDHDGYACYRKEVEIPEKYKNENIYLMLGRIDDIDEVYLNGQFIGSVNELKNRNNINGYGMEYTIQRVYPLPEYLIRYNGRNVITVVVYDERLRGGIYEGPIGIMNAYNYERYRMNNERRSTFWNDLIEIFGN